MLADGRSIALGALVVTVFAGAQVRGHVMHNCVNLTKPISLAGVRAPPGQQLLRGGDCDAGFCAGATRCYPTTAGIVYYAEFDVPPLPTTFEPESMTDYIYVRASHLQYQY